MTFDISNGHTSAPVSANSVNIGILALQGAFVEHQQMLSKLSSSHKIKTILVRTCDDLQVCDALIIPGGESTTIALLAKLSGLLEPLREFAKFKPIWGTCAGAILLAKNAVGMKKGGQDLLGGISLCIARNGWGTQVESFEAGLQVDGLRDSHKPFAGIFIRAPVPISFLPTGLNTPPIQVLARLPSDIVPPLTSCILDCIIQPQVTDVVALRQGMHLLTTFHPELTKDDRFHDYFVRKCVLPSLH